METEAEPEEDKSKATTESMDVEKKETDKKEGEKKEDEAKGEGKKAEEEKKVVEPDFEILKNPTRVTWAQQKFISYDTSQRYVPMKKV